MEIGLFGSAMAASPEHYPTIPLSVVAQEAEARGFESLFIGEHSHTPVDAVLPKWMGAVCGQPYPEDRKSVVEGNSVSVRVNLGGRRIIKKKKKNTQENR